MRTEGYETVEKRTSAPTVVRIDQKDRTLEHDVKAITTKDRIHLQRSPRADHWKYDGQKDQVFVPKPPPKAAQYTEIRTEGEVVGNVWV